MDTYKKPILELKNQFSSIYIVEVCFANIFEDVNPMTFSLQQNILVVSRQAFILC